MQTRRGLCTVRAGLVEKLPVPILVGRDCSVFHRYSEERPGRWKKSYSARRRRIRKTLCSQPAWAATHGGNSTSGPETSPDEDGEHPETDATATVEEALAEPTSNQEEDDSATVFSEFPQPELPPSAVPGKGELHCY
ncbi:hypothetical protein F2P81_007455 [Scophthalmus maximus]|uniref:Uncharacterized protein n=1 Tax=Scophthalmus maximus TaxID=52904 RepID=A0A6A4T5D9_SCOMX|nr:hypothetical protein F2P81_007455 [Scophthalmus maximus]